MNMTISTAPNAEPRFTIDNIPQFERKVRKWVAPQFDLRPFSKKPQAVVKRQTKPEHVANKLHHAATT
jgi:hypothetical protein